MKKQKMFCTFCGKPISKKYIDSKERDYCDHCHTIHYVNPLPVACCILANEKREVALVRRKNEPYKDMWCLPIGFAEADEEVQDAALRELHEETGVIGEIIRLIDVDTIDNYFYGSLAIITYEVKQIGGSLQPGDDASDARYFPLNEIPTLAWTSNHKALDIYQRTYKDTWAMLDSFKEIYPHDDYIDSLGGTKDHQVQLLSAIMINILVSDSDEIFNEWNKSIQQSFSLQADQAHIIEDLHHAILSVVTKKLEALWKTEDDIAFIEFGRRMHQSNIPLSNVYTLCATSRKAIWLHVVQKKIIASPLDIYAALEFNNRIVFIYDRIIHALIRGY